MTEKEDSILHALPSRPKDSRKAQGLSLDAIAKLSGVSRSMVSQIERGESTPTIATLWNLTRALNVDFAGLLDQTDAGDRIDVLKAPEVPTIDKVGQGCRVAILSPPEEAGVQEVYDISFLDGGSLQSKPHARGAREQLVVLEGHVRVPSGNATARLSAGDTARYAADLPHEIAALKGAARIFLIVKAG